MLRPLRLGLVYAATLVGCSSVEAPAPTAPLPSYRITGVSVIPLDYGEFVGSFYSDTLRAQLVFEVTTEAEVLGNVASGDVWLRDDPAAGFVVNPTLWNKCWLSFDRPIAYRGIRIPAGMNLLDIAAIPTPSTDLYFFYFLTPFASGQVVLRREFFTVEPGDYVVRFHWETASGDVFQDDVPVHVDLQ